MPKVKPMINEFGNVVKNQYTFHVDDCQFFQSYDDIVVKIDQSQVYVDIKAYRNMSVTTLKWALIFLKLTNDEFEESVSNGNILLIDLNEDT